MKPDHCPTHRHLKKAFNSVLDQIEFWDAAVDAMVIAFEKLVLITCGLIPIEASDDLLTAMERDLICVKRRGTSVTVVNILRTATNQSAAMVAHHACTVAAQKIKELKVHIEEPAKAPESMDNLMEWIAQWLQYDVAQGKANGGPQGSLPVDHHRRGLSDRLSPPRESAGKNSSTSPTSPGPLWKPLRWT